MSDHHDTRLLKEKDEIKVRDSLRDRQADLKDGIKNDKSDLNILGRTASSPLSASPEAMTLPLPVKSKVFNVSV